MTYFHSCCLILGNIRLYQLFDDLFADVKSTQDAYKAPNSTLAPSTGNAVDYIFALEQLDTAGYTCRALSLQPLASPVLQVLLQLVAFLAFDVGLLTRATSPKRASAAFVAQLPLLVLSALTIWSSVWQLFWWLAYLAYLACHFQTVLFKPVKKRSPPNPLPPLRKILLQNPLVPNAKRIDPPRHRRKVPTRLLNILLLPSLPFILKPLSLLRSFIR